jgi:hypothetical protein
MKHLILLFCCGLLFSACVKNNKKPVWISIDKWELDDSDNPQSDMGQLTKNFSEVWIYVDNKIIGVFELPCKVPVLVSGNKLIQLYPGIKNNGMASTKKIYPFVKPVEMTVDFVPGQTYSYTPHTKYYDNVKCWKEDFSTNSFQIDTDESHSNAAIMLGNDSDIALNDGNQYAQILLSLTDSLWIGTTMGDLVLPKGGKEVYLEIDYRNTNTIEAGIVAVSNSGYTTNYCGTINTQFTTPTVWKKIYIDLKESVSYSTSANYFEIYLKTLLDSGKTSSEIYIDNIKVVHFY